jgi:amino acid transporter
MSTPSTGGELGERRLGTIHAVAQALAIGPMFSVALVLWLVSVPPNGSLFNATLSVLIAGLGVLAIAYVLSLYARRYAGAGAVYEYLTHGAHPAVGVFTAGLFFVGTLFLGGGGIYLGLGILSENYWGAHISDVDSAPEYWIFALIFLVFVLALNYWGVRLAIRAMLAFAAVSFTAMTILAIAIIIDGGPDGNTLEMFNPNTTDWSTVFGGVMIGILLFVGFEAAASIGEESHDPHRSIPRALIGTVAASAAFYVLMSYAISVGVGKAAIDEGTGWNPTTLTVMADQYVGDWYAKIIDAVVILDAAALALAICVTLGRGYFALGRDGLLPSAFARTSRHGTPWVGNLVVVIGCVGLIAVAELSSRMEEYAAIFGSTEYAAFATSATAGSFAVELVYLILAVAAFGLLARHGGTWWQYLIAIVAVATPIAGFWGALEPDPHDRTNPNWLALYWALGVVVLAAVWFVVMQVWKPDRIRNAALHAAEHQGVPALDENVDFTPAPDDTTPL